VFPRDIFNAGTILKHTPEDFMNEAKEFALKLFSEDHSSSPNETAHLLYWLTDIYCFDLLELQKISQ